MTQPTITRIRDLVRSLNYVVSIHAAEELDDDNLTLGELPAETVVKIGPTGKLVVITAYLA